MEYIEKGRAAQRIPGLLQKSWEVKEQMKKKVLAFVLALALVFALATPALAARTFTDVRGSRWSYKPIEYAYAQGYMNGIGDGAFDPAGTVVRAMVAQVLWKKAGQPAAAITNPFEDVSDGAWFAEAVVWCKGESIINGATETTFAPVRPVIRQDVCVMVYNYVKAMEDISLDKATDAEMAQFSDAGSVASYAEDAVRWAVKSKFMSGSDGKLNPNDTASREQLAQFFLNLDSILGLDTNIDLPVDDEPEPPPFEDAVRISQNAAGVYVNGLAFNPQMGYNSQVVLGQDRFYADENAGNMVNRSGAYIAVNGAFFQSGSTLETDATVISNGQLIRSDNWGSPAKSTFVIDKSGRASIQHMTIMETFRKFRNGEDVTIVDPLVAETNIPLPFTNDWGANRRYTRAFGATVPGHVHTAVVVDENGVVTAKYTDADNVPIPEKGYVLCKRSLMSQWDTFLPDTEVGDTIVHNVEYKGSTTQEIATALSCGPTIVKNGAAYGNNDTYAEEKFGSVKRGNLARMAIGVRADGTVVIINATCDLPQLGQAMAALGCQDAMNLDGGASTLLYHNGGYIASPGRKLTNLLVFTRAQ